MNIEQRNKFVLECRPIVERIVRSMGIDPNYADDCIQAGMLSVIKSCDSYDPRSGHDPVGWAKLSIAREVRREWKRLLQPHDQVSLEEILENEKDSESILPTTDDDRLAQLMKKESLIDAIFALKDDRALVLMMNVLEGYTVSEAGRRLGLTQSSADRLYQRTVDELRVTLGAGNSHT